MKFKTKLCLYAVAFCVLYVLYCIYGNDVATYLRKHRATIIAGMVTFILLLCAIYFKGLKKGKHEKTGRGKRKAVSKTPKNGSIPKGSILVIDTNVWMNSSLTSWFTQLSKKAKSSKYIIHVENIVLGELKGLTKNAEKAKDAHTGMKRIEDLQITLSSANFRMEDHANRKSDHFADPVLVRYAKSKKDSIIITDDRELRILAREQGISALRPADCRF